MPDIRISELPALPDGGIQNNDKIVVVRGDRTYRATGADLGPSWVEAHSQDIAVLAAWRYYDTGYSIPSTPMDTLVTILDGGSYRGMEIYSVQFPSMAIGVIGYARIHPVPAGTGLPNFFLAGAAGNNQTATVYFAKTQQGNLIFLSSATNVEPMPMKIYERG